MSLNVLINSRDEKVFDGTAQSVTSYNEVGEFDILDSHANFITLVGRYVILDKGSSHELKTEIKSGVLKCDKNNVEVYIN